MLNFTFIRCTLSMALQNSVNNHRNIINEHIFSFVNTNGQYPKLFNQFGFIDDLSSCINSGEWNSSKSK